MRRTQPENKKRQGQGSERVGRGFTGVCEAGGAGRRWLWGPERGCKRHVTWAMGRKDRRIPGFVVAVCTLCVLATSSAWAQEPTRATEPGKLPAVQPAGVRTPFSTFADQIEMLDQALQQGSIDSPQHALLVKRAIEELEKAQQLSGEPEAASATDGERKDRGVQEALWEPDPAKLLDAPPVSVTRELELLKQRLGELETARMAHEDATRTIIRRSFAERASNITEHVQFGGTLETLASWSEDFDGKSESDIILDTAEIDFEIQLNDWVLGSLVFEYVSPTGVLFPTSTGDIFVDRFNVRQAWVTIGNTQKCWLFATAGQDVVPFGISTGDPVLDVLSIEDPLTVEVFETKEDFILIGFEAPTPPPRPTPTAPAAASIPPRPVRPVLIAPLFRQLSRQICPGLACTPPTPTRPPATPATPTPTPPPFNGGIYFYNGDTNDGGGDHIEQIGGTLGYRKKGAFSPCNLWSCWTLDMDVDFNSSVFDSNFLQFEYRPFLEDIGFVPGMAAHVKSSLGPVGLILEWNGAINDAKFTDDLGTDVSIAPQAWQISINYQFDWNPSVERLGLQGTYLVFGYSQSQDLAGVTRVIGGEEKRVGFVPKRRFLVGLGEWVMDGLRVAIEYSHIVDYSEDEGGTGNSADGVFGQLTYEW